GETLAMLTAPTETVPFVLVNDIVPLPGAVSPGIRKLICVGETKKSGASRGVPIASMTVTEAPARVVGSCSLAGGYCVDVAKFCPTAPGIDWGGSCVPR